MTQIVEVDVCEVRELDYGMIIQESINIQVLKKRNYKINGLRFYYTLLNIYKIVFYYRL